VAKYVQGKFHCQPQPRMFSRRRGLLSPENAGDP
jgi:hypothetical protein